MPSEATTPPKRLVRPSICEQRVSHGAASPAGRRCRRARTARPAAAAGRARSASIPRRATPSSPTNGVADELDQRRQRFLQHQQRDRADQRAEGRAHAAEHHHDDQVARARPVHHRRADELGVVGEQHAGQAAHRAGDDEAGRAGSGRSESRSPHAPLVRARALDHQAEARIHDAARRDRCSRAGARGTDNRTCVRFERLIGRRTGCAGRWSGRRRRRSGRADAEVVDHLREGERDHDEVEPRVRRLQRADAEREQRGGQRARPATARSRSRCLHARGCRPRSRRCRDRRRGRSSPCRRSRGSG